MPNAQGEFTDDELLKISLHYREVGAPLAPWAYRGVYRYRIRSTKLSSAHFGACEICQTHASEVWIQVEERFFTFLHVTGERSTHPKYDDFYGTSGCLPGRHRHCGWTQSGCHSRFGHVECLHRQGRGTDG
jgi:hypothetical protein